MDSIAVFIDVGYLFAAGSKLITGSTQKRVDLVLDVKAVRELLIDKSKSCDEGRLLRIYWYDGAMSGPNTQQLTVAYLPDVKLRLGMINGAGQQKGVDSLIVTDLINLARNRSISTALLLSGDEDIRVGVQQAQEAGVRIHLLGIAPSASNMSNLLRQEADTLTELDKSEISKVLTHAPKAVASPAQAFKAALSNSTANLDDVANEVANALTPETRSVVVQGGDYLPREIDASLLAKGRDALGKSLEPPEKRSLRKKFREICKTLADSQDTSE